MATNRLYHYLCTIFPKGFADDTHLEKSRATFVEQLQYLTVKSRGVMTVLKSELEKRYQETISYRTWYRWLVEFPELREIITDAGQKGFEKSQSKNSPTKGGNP